MDLETIQKLMEKMEKHKMTRLCLKEKSGFSIELERKHEASEICYRDSKVDQENVKKFQGNAPLPPQGKKTKEISKDDDKERKTFEVTSPMVGTFYATPSPDDPPFIKQGDLVNEDTIVCIIEAMKVMNEVKAGKKGKIVEVYVDNGCSVEFGTKLFCIEV